MSGGKSTCHTYENTKACREGPARAQCGDGPHRKIHRYCNSGSRQSLPPAKLLLQPSGKSFVGVICSRLHVGLGNVNVSGTKS
jgi:hypothetical protein